MNKISCRHFYNFTVISKRDEASIIKDMKEKVKADPSIVEKFKEYDVPLDEIDGVSVEFADLDVSAKTKDCNIYINRKMLDPDSDVRPENYLCHELVHFLQQSTGKNLEKHNDTDDYLNKPTETESFSVQEDFMERNEGEEAAEEYVEDLLDYHDYSGKKREKKKEELMSDSTEN